MGNDRAARAFIKLGGPDALSPLEVVQLAQQLTGKAVTVQHVPEEALRARTQLPSQIVGSTKNYCKMGGAGISCAGSGGTGRASSTL